MFSLFKRNPTKNLQKEYEKLLKEAQLLQRNGKIPEYATKTAEANKIYEQIQQYQQQSA